MPEIFDKFSSLDPERERAQIEEAVGGDIPGFTSSLNTTAPNDTINVSVLAASDGTAVQDIAIVPTLAVGETAGAFSVDTPDGTAVGGNKRGAGAVDLQRFRSDAAQVASGFASFLAGYQNRANGSESTALGAGCIASEEYSFALGLGCVADGSASFAWGHFSTTRGIYNAESIGIQNGTPPTSLGQLQSGRYVLANLTADDTPTVLTSDGNTADDDNQVWLPNNASYKFRGQIVGANSANGDTSGWDFSGVIKRGANAAATVLVAAVTPTMVAQDAGLSATVVTVTADTTNGALAVTVTGIAATNIQWMCDVMTSETTY